jgi:hypothetical protein
MILAGPRRGTVAGIRLAARDRARTFSFSLGSHELRQEGSCDWRCRGDTFFTLFGFIPILGDIASTGWFVGWDLYDCSRGNCNPAMLLLDLAGAAPFVPNLGQGRGRSIF